MKSGWSGESQRHSMAKRGIISTEIRIPTKGIEETNQTFIVTLPEGVYDKNKVRLKAIFKQFGLEFNKKEYFVGKFIWQSPTESVEGKFEKNEQGVTTKATFLLNTGDSFNNVFRPIIKILGGDWCNAEETKNVEKNALYDIVKEELRARNRRWPHSPLLKPMIKEYFTKNNIAFDNKKIIDTEREVWEQADKTLNQN